MGVAELRLDRSNVSQVEARAKVYVDALESGAAVRGENVIDVPQINRDVKVMTVGIEITEADDARDMLRRPIPGLRGPRLCGEARPGIGFLAA
jgi:hypothetical protein